MTLLERYNLIPSESVFIDDNQNNITTGNSLGIISKKVEPDNYDSIVNIINAIIANNRLILSNNKILFLLFKNLEIQNIR